MHEKEEPPSRSPSGDHLPPTEDGKPEEHQEASGGSFKDYIVSCLGSPFKPSLLTLSAYLSICGQAKRYPQHRLGCCINWGGHYYATDDRRFWQLGITV
jgi:hypothetical protein